MLANINEPPSRKIQITLFKKNNKHYRILTFTQKGKKIVNTNKIDQHKCVLPGMILHMEKKIIKMGYKGTLRAL